MSTNTFMDIKPIKNIHDLTLDELTATYSEEYKRKNNIIIGTRIPVKYEIECWNCNTVFMAGPYQNYCSERCTTIGEWKQNNFDWEK